MCSATKGSGYWIGRAALRAVLRESDRRGPRTALTPLLLQHFGVAEAQSLIHEVYQSNLRPAAIGSLARCVQAAFSEGDEAASGILRAAADELESSGVSVARRLDLGAEAFPFILGGGIFRAVPWLRDELSRRLPDRRPREHRASARPRACRRRRVVRDSGSEGRGTHSEVPIRVTPTPGPPRIAVFADAAAAAHALTDRIVGALARNSRLVLGLPTGRTPVAFYHELAVTRGEWRGRPVAGDDVQSR